RRVQVEEPLVEAFSLAEREEVEPVVVPRDEEDPRPDRTPVDERLHGTVAEESELERAQRRARLAAAAVPLAPVDEPRVHAERDVVQERAPVHAADVHAPLAAAERVECRERVVASEAEVAGEVVARTERDAYEREVPLERDV